MQAAGDFTLKVGRQGCADQGLCYPPMVTPIKLQIAAISTAATSEANNPGNSGVTGSEAANTKT
ncbi:protein-disulfide reductase DsbD domain-containing protein, partial [Acinetobacter baumannii]